jgi:lipopolysaccharide/colanic/teichoic acid biosynthesis glycosyltransferase
MSVDVTTMAELTRSEAPRRPALSLAHRTLDVSIAGLALLVLVPVIAAAALAVRLSSPGPVLFRQRRLGRGMRPFTVLKFRTMRADADSAVHREFVRSLIAGKPEPDEHGQLYKLVVDDRVTRVGRFLRSWSLDEVPQLWNVLRGDMSLVGPRPVIEYEVEQYPDWYLQRFAVKPGMTGLWQVSGRNERTYEEMVRFDVEYAERRSLFLDLRILARTALVVMRRQGVA